MKAWAVFFNGEFAIAYPRKVMAQAYASHYYNSKLISIKEVEIKMDEVLKEDEVTDMDEQTKVSDEENDSDIDDDADDADSDASEDSEDSEGEKSDK